jgi:hypothetical protein
MEIQVEKDIDKCTNYSKKKIKTEILRILTDKNVEEPVRSKILNSLVNFTHRYLRNTNKPRNLND